jgi:hypothetical protein
MSLGLTGPVGHAGLVAIVPSVMALVLLGLECTDGLRDPNPSFWPNAISRHRIPVDPDDPDVDSTEPLLGTPWRQVDAFVSPVVQRVYRVGTHVPSSAYQGVRVSAISVHALLMLALHAIGVLCWATGADSPLDGVHNYTAIQAQFLVAPSYNRLPMLFSRTVAGAWALLIGGSLLVTVAAGSLNALIWLQYVHVSALYFYERPVIAVVFGFVGTGPFPTLSLDTAGSGGDTRNFWASVNLAALGVTIALLCATTDNQLYGCLVIVLDLLAVSVCSGSLLVSAVLRYEWDDFVCPGTIMDMWVWFINTPSLTVVSQYCADLNVVNAKGESLLLKASVCGFDGSVRLMCGQEPSALDRVGPLQHKHLCDIEASIDPVDGKTPLLAAVAALGAALKTAAAAAAADPSQGQPVAETLGLEPRLRGIIMHLAEACGGQRYPAVNDGRDGRMDRMNATSTVVTAAEAGVSGHEQEYMYDTALMAITRLEDIEALICFLTPHWVINARPHACVLPFPEGSTFCRGVLDAVNAHSGLSSLHMALQQQWYAGACLLLRAGADRQLTTAKGTPPLVLALRGLGVPVPVPVPVASEPEPEADEQGAQGMVIKYAEDTVVMQSADLSRNFRRSRHDCVRSLCNSLISTGGMAVFEDLLLPLIRSYAASPSPDPAAGIQLLTKVGENGHGKTAASLCYQRNCPRSLALVCRMLFEHHPHAVLRHGLLPLECTGVLPPAAADLVQLVAVTWLRDLLINHRGDFVVPVVAELRAAVAQSRLPITLDPPLQDEGNEEDLDVERVRTSLSGLVTALSKLEDDMEEAEVTAMDQQPGVYTVSADGLDASTGVDASNALMLAELTRHNRRLRAEYRPPTSGTRAGTPPPRNFPWGAPNPPVASADDGSGSDDDGSDDYGSDYDDHETIRGETARTLLESRLQIELLQLAFDIGAGGPGYEVCDSPNLLGCIASIEPSARLATLRMAYIHVAEHCGDRLTACNEYLKCDAHARRQDQTSDHKSSTAFVNERVKVLLDLNDELPADVIAALREDTVTPQQRQQSHAGEAGTAGHMLAVLANLLAFMVELEASAKPAAAAVGLAQSAAKAIFSHQCIVPADPYEMAADVFYDASRKSWRRWDTKTIQRIEAIITALPSSSPSAAAAAAAAAAGSGGTAGTAAAAAGTAGGGSPTAVAEANERLFEALEATVGTFGSVLESGQGLKARRSRELMKVDETHANEIFCTTEALLLCTLGSESLLGVPRQEREVIGTAIPAAQRGIEPPATPIGGDALSRTRTGAAAAAWETPTAKPAAAAEQGEDDKDGGVELSRSQSERIHRSISRTSSAAFGTPMNAPHPIADPELEAAAVAVPLGQRVRHLLLTQTVFNRFLEKRTGHHHLRGGSLSFLQHYPACVDMRARIALASYSITRTMAVPPPVNLYPIQIHPCTPVFGCIDDV